MISIHFQLELISDSSHHTNIDLICLDFPGIIFGVFLDKIIHNQTQNIFFFRAFRLDVGERRLWRESEVIPLTSKQFELLLYFVENTGRIAKKSDLLDAVWTDTYVEETTLARNVSWLRKLLEDGENGERIIETVPKVGYRFTAKVTKPAADENLIIVEEQIVQHFRGEETLTISDPDIFDIETRRREEIAQIEQRIPSASRFNVSPLLFLALCIIAVAVISLLIYQNFFKTNFTKPIVATNLAPFTTATGYEDNPAFSPDGKFIAYSWNGGKGGEYGEKSIYIKAVKTGEPRQLTNNEGNEHYPVFSPDGLQIAFIRGKYGTPGELIIIPFLGGTERRLAHLFSGNYSISFSPTGEHIAVIDTEDSTEKGQYAVYLIDIKTSERRRVTAPAEFEGETTPRFSPDGKNLAFIRIASTDNKQFIGNQDLFVVPVKGGEPKQITFDRSTINSLVWNADGDRIYFVSHRLGNQLRVWSVSPIGGEPSIVSTGAKDIRNLTVSPDGKKLVFSERNRHRFIWEIPSNGEPPRKLIESSLDQFYPQFSPDGKQIAYHSGFGEAGETFNSNLIQIWLADSNGENPRRITNEQYPAREPQFSPDGTKIAFDMETEEGFANYSVSTDGTNLRRISPKNWQADSPMWSNDGEFIFFISNQSGEKNIWRIKSDGSGEPFQITKNGAYRSFPAPDGKYLYYIKEKFPNQFIQNKQFPEDLWRVSIQDGSEEAMPQFSAAGFFGVFTVAKFGVYFLSKDPLKLKFYDFVDRKIKDAPGKYQIPWDIDKEFIFKDVISVNERALLSTVSTHTSRLMIADLQ